MKFSEVLGNEQAIGQIRRMIDTDRLPHALLLYGEPGVPKLGLAMAAAQYLHCKNHVDGDSCGVCPMCRQHQSFNQVDTHYSYPFTNRKSDSTNQCDADDYIDEWREFVTKYPVEDYQAWLTLLKNDNAQPQIFVREADNIMRKMTLSAYTAKYKVLILWLPEKLKDEAANKKPSWEPSCRAASASSYASLPHRWSRSIWPNVTVWTCRMRLLSLHPPTATLSWLSAWWKQAVSSMSSVNVSSN